MPRYFSVDVRKYCDSLRTIIDMYCAPKHCSEPRRVGENSLPVYVRSFSTSQDYLANVYLPSTRPSAGGPLATVYHGGGWCARGLEEKEPLCKSLASRFGAVVVNVNYRHSPEHKFPVAFNDSLDATKWMGIPSRNFAEQNRNVPILSAEAVELSSTSYISLDTVSDPRFKPPPVSDRT
nr:ab hydrolase superfamily protein b1a11.02 [Quercus suber]